MSLNKLQIELLSKDKFSLHLQITFNKESGVFEGHFPDFPLLAGVLQIDIALKAYMKFQATSLPFKGVNNVKFFNPIFPNDRVDLKCEVSEEGFWFHFYNKKMTFSKGMVTLKNE